jgi:hypothetical protein
VFGLLLLLLLVSSHLTEYSIAHCGVPASVVAAAKGPLGLKSFVGAVELNPSSSQEGSNSIVGDFFFMNSRQPVSCCHPPPHPSSPPFFVLCSVSVFRIFSKIRLGFMTSCYSPVSTAPETTAVFGKLLYENAFTCF